MTNRGDPEVITPRISKAIVLGLEYSYHFNDAKGSWLGASGEDEIYFNVVSVDAASFITLDGVQAPAIHKTQTWDGIGGIFHFNLLAGRSIDMGKQRTLEYFGGAGLVETTLTYAFGPIYKYAGTTLVNYGSTALFFADEHRVAPSARLGCDIVWSKKRHRSLSLGMLVVVTGRYITGGYQIQTGTPQESSGDFKGTFSYLGIRFGYGLRWGKQPHFGSSATKPLKSDQ